MDGFVYVGFWKRALASLIDAIIGWAFMPITMPLITWSLSNRTIIPDLIWSLVWSVVWLWIVVRFGGTPGKLIIGVRIVDASGSFLYWGRAIRRIIFPSIIMSVNSHLQIWRAYSTFTVSTPHLSFMEMGRILNEYGQPFSVIAMILGLSIYIDIGVILFNRKKRAIHDFIAGSYVITKASYMSLAEPAVSAASQGGAAVAE